MKSGSESQKKGIRVCSIDIPPHKHARTELTAKKEAKKVKNFIFLRVSSLVGEQGSCR